jgi:hypothetical protein
MGRIDKSTNDRNISVPSSFGRAEGRRRAVQKHFCSLADVECRNE